MAPVRVNPEQNPEVVWARRIDPARAVLSSVPFPESGRRWRDVILHDGAPNGERNVDGRTYSVFDEIEVWESSNIPTLRADIHVASDDDAADLVDAFTEAGWGAEDWSANTRIICRQCSEGNPDGHDHTEIDAGRQRMFGLAAPLDRADLLLQAWRKRGRRQRRVESLTVLL
jgi:hypothetical protein